MKTMTKKATRRLSRILAGLMMVMCISCLSPAITVRAEDDKTKTSEATDKGDKDKNDINQVKVSMDKNGKLTIDGIEDGNSSSTWGTIFDKTKIFIIGLSGIGFLAFLGFGIKSLMSLGASAGNPNARSEALKALLWQGLAAAGCGSITLIVGLFWNGLK